MHATISDVIADTAQNSIEAGARNISLSLQEADGRISVSIKDDGKGMDAETLGKAFNPFYTEAGKHDKRKVGLGLPILKQLCESTGGGVSLTSEKGVGTQLLYHFDAGNIDLPPMGDLVEMVVMLFNYPGDFDLVFTHAKGGDSYSISRLELSEAVGGFENVESIALAKEFLQSQEEALATGNA